MLRKAGLSESFQPALAPGRPAPAPGGWSGEEPGLAAALGQPQQRGRQLGPRRAGSREMTSTWCRPRRPCPGSTASPAWSDGRGQQLGGPRPGSGPRPGACRLASAVTSSSSATRASRGGLRGGLGRGRRGVPVRRGAGRRRGVRVRRQADERLGGQASKGQRAVGAAQPHSRRARPGRGTAWPGSRARRSGRAARPGPPASGPGWHAGRGQDRGDLGQPPGPRVPARVGHDLPSTVMSQVSSAFWAWSRFSAWSQTTLAGPSRTAAAISCPRCAGRQCSTPRQPTAAASRASSRQNGSIAAIRSSSWPS